MERNDKDWVRRANRRPTHLRGTASRPGGALVRVLLSNITYDGCHLWCEGELEKGELLQIRVEGLSVMPAQVRWASGDRAGVKFVTGNSAVDARRARLGV